MEAESKQAQNNKLKQLKLKQKTMSEQIKKVEYAQQKKERLNDQHREKLKKIKEKIRKKQSINVHEKSFSDIESKRLDNLRNVTEFRQKQDELDYYNAISLKEGSEYRQMIKQKNRDDLTQKQIQRLQQHNVDTLNKNYQKA